MKGFAIILMCVLALTGCVKVEQAFDIGKDGSATLEVSYSMSEMTVDRMKAMIKLKHGMRMAVEDAEDTGPQWDELFLNPIEVKIRLNIEKYKDYGISLEKLKVETRNAWRHVHLKVRFDDIAKAAKADFFSEYGFSLTKTSDGNYVLHRDPPNDEPMTTVDMADPETLKTVTPVLSGFRVTLKVGVPGTILKTNAHQQGLNTAIWDFDFNQNINALLAYQKQALDIAFEGKNLELPQVKVGTRIKKKATTRR